MAQEQVTQTQAQAEAKEAGLLDQIISKSRIKSKQQQEHAKDLIGEMVGQILDGTMTVSKDLIATIEARMAEIDRVLSKQVNEIIHHDEFKKLEGSWRGLHYLVHHSETSTNLKLRVFNSSKKELVKEFKNSAEFDQSAVFKKVYEEEFGVFGGAPFAALIGDYEFSNHPEDLYLLSEMSHVAAAAHAPFLSAADPEMFQLESFTELQNPRDLAKIFDTVEYAKWKSFRESEDSRYVGLTMPRTLARLPYGEKSVPVEEFNFEEDTDGHDHNKFVWTNAAYSLGARLTDAYAKYGWCAAIRGVEGGGLVEDLPTHTYNTDDGEVVMKCPTEIAIPDRREKELADLGFIPLIHCKGTDYAAFFGAQSAQKPKEYNTDAATANARLSSQLQYLMATSRIAHYLKSIMRDKIGSFASRKNVEDYLNTWISQYVLADDDAGQEFKAKFPLREAKVEVVEIPGKPGCYNAVAFLRPHFQLDELTTSLRLVAELPQSAS